MQIRIRFTATGDAMMDGPAVASSNSSHDHQTSSQTGSPCAITTKLIHITSPSYQAEKLGLGCVSDDMASDDALNCANGGQQHQRQ